MDVECWHGFVPSLQDFIAYTRYLFSSPEPRTTSLLKPWANFLQLHVKPSVKGGLKICTNSHGPLIKMVAMPVYDKTLKTPSQEPRKL